MNTEYIKISPVEAVRLMLEEAKATRRAYVSQLKEAEIHLTGLRKNAKAS